jgi:GPH family glycoside/pentoside/hexuronide:cation symporter
MSQSPKAKRFSLPLAHRAAYGLPDLGVGIFVTLKAVLLLPFMTKYLGIPIQTAGLVLTVGLLLDILTDPIVGWLSDNTRGRWGKRVPYIAVGAVVLAAATALIFAVPNDWQGASAERWVFGAFVLATLGYTLIIIPHGSLTAEMTRDPLERSSLTGWRMAIFSIGILVAGGVLPGIIAAFGGGRTGAFWGYVTMVPLIVLPSWISCWAIRRYDTAPPQPLQSPFKQIAKVFKNRNFLLLMGLFSIQLLGFGLITQSIDFFSTYLVLDDNPQGFFGLVGMLGTFATMFALVTLASMASQPLWTLASAWLGKMRAYQLGMGGFAVLMAGFYFTLPSTNIDATCWYVVAIGVFYGCLLQLPWALMPDLIEPSLDADRQGIGAFNAYWLFGQKVANAVGPGLLAFILGGFGWQESTQGAAAQGQAAISALAVSMTLLPALIFAFSVVLLVWLERHLEARPGS